MCFYEAKFIKLVPNNVTRKTILEGCPLFLGVAAQKRSNCSIMRRKNKAALEYFLKGRTRYTNHESRAQWIHFLNSNEFYNKPKFLEYHFHLYVCTKTGYVFVWVTQGTYLPNFSKIRKFLSFYFLFFLVPFTGV